MEVVILVTLYGISLFKEPDCDTVLRLKAPGISILWGYFGFDKTCLNRFMPQIRYLQIHPSFHATLARHSIRARKGIYGFCAKWPEVTCIVSLGLEDKYSPTQRIRAARAFKKKKPDNVVLSSNSTTCPACRPRGVKYLETHTDGATRGFEIASNDGWGLCFKGKHQCDITLQQVRENLAASKELKIFALWYGEGQGISKPEDRFIKPWKRVPQVTKKQVREINQYFNGG